MTKASEGVILFKESLFYGLVISISLKYSNSCCKLLLTILVMRSLGLTIESIRLSNS